ncbi:hypothetical protein [Rhizobium phage RHph_I40]|uniref:Uncharacterized protein n=1 Tax=Rhizobium phage RHph_I38 TaxID=2509734 RepID=A0A7S5UWE8_9CAUD|nr:hypothetical protein EVC01_051 [Rhizobium phage RHph_I38]QXV73680.1 hypothetical protein [Rhizobium phage RHph_I40]
MSGWNDPVLPDARVDNKPGTEKPFMRHSRVRLGTVPQRNHSVQKIK